MGGGCFWGARGGGARFSRLLMCWNFRVNLGDEDLSMWCDTCTFLKMEDCEVGGWWGAWNPPGGDGGRAYGSSGVGCGEALLLL